MRQAGRYMAEYRAVRERFGFLELCQHPDAAAEVTVTAVERLGVDAAIIFADILLVARAARRRASSSAAGDGPVLHRPVRTPDDVARLPRLRRRRRAGLRLRRRPRGARRASADACR